MVLFILLFYVLPLALSAYAFISNYSYQVPRWMVLLSVIYTIIPMFNFIPAIVFLQENSISGWLSKSSGKEPK